MFTTIETFEKKVLTKNPEVGDLLILKCLSIGSKGDGICKTKNGFVVIVRGAEKGKKYALKVVLVKEKVAFAEIQQEVTA